MKIIYTDITSNLTEILAEELVSLRKEAKRIFYIVPSSLSFEKEREVLEQRSILERLSRQQDNFNSKERSESFETALFDVLVTRFKQLPYYFQERAKYNEKPILSPSGQAMLFKKILQGFSESELEYYDNMRDSEGFIEKLVQLRQEMTTANLEANDLILGTLAESKKNQDLAKIMRHFEHEAQCKFTAQDSFTTFINELLMGEYDEVIKDSIFIVAGFTRFSAQEEILVKILDKYGQVVLATYASPKALNQHEKVLGVYSDPVKLIDKFTDKNTDIVYENPESIDKYVNKVDRKIYSKLTRIWEAENDFLHNYDEQIDGISASETSDKIEIWQAENIHAEVEMVAKQIRQKIVENHLHADKKLKYKNFSVFVANPEKYELVIKNIFSSYEIPYFYSQEELMRNHPLITFLESLLAIKKNNYQIIDVVNLLKTGLFGNIEDESTDLLDYFEYYLKKFKIRGKRKFGLEFNEINYPENPSDRPSGYFKEINDSEAIRKEYFSSDSALNNFFTNKKKDTEALLKDFLDFLRKISLPENFQKLYEANDDNEIREKHQQVWRLFQNNLKEVKEVFKQEEMTSEELLTLLVSAVKNASYRQVPANVDTVKIRDYELVEPQENDYVYLLGMTINNFPRIKKNQSLLSEEERMQINASVEPGKFIESIETSNPQKNSFTILSLLNSAKCKLTLSSPQIFDNVQVSEMTPLLQLLIDKGVAVKNIYTANSHETVGHIGTEQATIQSILTLNFDSDGIENNFWIRIRNYLEKRNPQFAKLLQASSRDIESAGLSSEVSSKIYSNLQASASAFEEFYNCQYKYFLDHTLGLQELEEVTLESSTIGNYFHRIFQLTLQDGSNSLDFDAALKQAKKQVDREYAQVFERDALSRFTKANLAEILEESATMVKESLKQFEVARGNTERSFSNIDALPIRGKIDSVDSFEKSGQQFLGAIDYKSSDHEFNLRDIYNKTSLQLLTYLSALSKNENFDKKKELWGALYLHLQNPIIDLGKLDYLGQINQKIFEEMRFKGLVNEEAFMEELDQLKFIKTTKESKNYFGNRFTAKQIDKLLDYNLQLYEEAFSKLKSSQIEINPISDKNDDRYNVKGCRFCPYKSICRFEATEHQGRIINRINGKNINIARDKEEMKNKIFGRS